MCSCSSVSWTIWDSFEFWWVGDDHFPFSIIWYLLSPFDNLFKSGKSWCGKAGVAKQNISCVNNPNIPFRAGARERKISMIYILLWDMTDHTKVDIRSNWPQFLQTRLGEYCYKYTNISAKQSWPDCEESFRLDKIRKLYNFIEMKSFNLSKENFIATHQEIPDRNLDLDKIILIRT